MPPPILLCGEIFFNLLATRTSVHAVFSDRTWQISIAWKNLKNPPRTYKIHQMHWKEAKGPTFARYHCFKLVKNEEYFLQIDCHTRFFENCLEIGSVCDIHFFS